MRKKKVILITGASSGIGYATAKLLLKEGHIVYCASRRLHEMKGLEALGGKRVYVDVTDEDTIKRAVNLIIDTEKRIDVVFANAGYGCAGALETVSVEDGKHEFDVNFFGMIRTIKAVMPYMRKQRYGYVIVTSSMAAFNSIPCMGYYPASKSAIEGMIDAFRMETKKFGIHVVKIQPYFVDTEFIFPVKKTLDKAMKSKNAEAYMDELKSFERTFIAMTSKGMNAKKVAKVVSKVLRTRKPEIEYEVGWQCRVSKAAKKIFGNRFIDFMTRKIILRK